MPFENYHSILEVKFDEDETGQLMKQVCTEIKDVSLMNAQASVTVASGDYEHREEVDNELDNGAEFMTVEEGYHASGTTHKEWHSAKMARVGISKEFNRNATKLAGAEAERKRAEDLKKAGDALNRKDAKALVYGGLAFSQMDGGVADYKSYNGLAYFTKHCTDLAAFDRSFYGSVVPFEGEDMCLTIDNQKDVTSPFKLNASVAGDSSHLSVNDSLFSSIYAIIWGGGYCTKLVPKGMNAGMSFDAHYDQRKEYNDPVDGITKHFYFDSVDMDKWTGLFVGSRWSVIRIANIRMDRKLISKTAWEEEMERVETSCALAEKYLREMGLLGQSKWYASGNLLMQLKKFRKDRATMITYNEKPVGIDQGIPFYINDSVLLQDEFALNPMEKHVAGINFAG